MDGSPRTLAPLGCAIFVILGFTFGLIGLINISSEEYKSTHEYDWWIIMLFGITILYLILNIRYLIIFPSFNESYSKSMFIMGRSLCFYAFPCFAYLMALLTWYVTGETRTASVLGIIGGWLITKTLQKTIFAYEYINRDIF